MNAKNPKEKPPMNPTFGLMALLIAVAVCAYMLYLLAKSENNKAMWQRRCIQAENGLQDEAQRFSRLQLIFQLATTESVPQIETTQDGPTSAPLFLVG
jgi:hypothetical protein